MDESNKIVEIPVDGVLDLHTFAPREVAAVVLAYLLECAREGILEVRLIHGKGIGNLRRIVEAVCDRHPSVVRHRPGSESEGGWGATVGTLRRGQP